MKIQDHGLHVRPNLPLLFAGSDQFDPHLQKEGKIRDNRDDFGDWWIQGLFTIFSLIDKNGNVSGRFGSVKKFMGTNEINL